MAIAWLGANSGLFLNKEDVIREGFLLKESKVLKVWRKRWCVLTSSCLYAFKKQGDNTHPTEFLRFDSCLCVKPLSHSAGHRNILCIDSPDRTFLLSANSDAERDAWAEALHNVCMPLMVCRGFHGRCLSEFPIVESEFEEAGHED
mmetsp:Transcript_104682/g.165281  ORF Transcript_104682/g.165281 Transcript_104682/m.165281 type:complete len:146 (-) Transcript_104682:262-699(-)